MMIEFDDLTNTCRILNLTMENEWFHNKDRSYWQDKIFFQIVVNVTSHCGKNLPVLNFLAYYHKLNWKNTWFTVLNEMAALELLT